MLQQPWWIQILAWKLWYGQKRFSNTVSFSDYVGGRDLEPGLACLTRLVLDVDQSLRSSECLLSWDTAGESETGLAKAASDQCVLQMRSLG